MYNVCDILESESIYLVPELRPAPFGKNERTEAEYGGRSGLRPLHSGTAQPLFDHRFAGCLGHTRTDRQAVFPKAGVVHLGQMILEVTDRGFQIFAGRSSGLPLGQSFFHLAQQLFGSAGFFLQAITTLLKPRRSSLA